MWSVPFNLNVHDSYLAVGMVYNEAGWRELVKLSL
jgi:hypothetical protein